MTLVRLMLYDAAASEGVETMFDGVDGDATVIPATDRLLQLARSLRLGELGSDVVGAVWRHGRAGASFTLHSLIAPLRERVSMMRGRLPSYIADSPVRTDVLRRTGVLDAIESAAGPIGDVRSGHISSIRDGLLAAGLESTAALGASVGLEVRHPFADRRLIELAVAMPAKQLYRKGETRYIERIALTGFAPRDVMFRGSKGGLPPAYARKYLRLLNIDEIVRDGGGVVGDLVDPNKLARIWESWRTDSGIAQGWALLPLAVTARWIAGMDERQAGHGLAT
jgi:asparagine synthase (glutamine-hydrolysing)